MGPPLARALGISEHAVSELLGDLKAKGYVVDTEAVYESADSVSKLHVEADSGRRSSLVNERCTAVLHDLKSYTLTTDWPANRIAAVGFAGKSHAGRRCDV
jgi:DNA-binding Lrp family transcriptional regulator